MQPPHPTLPSRLGQVNPALTVNFCTLPSKERDRNCEKSLDTCFIGRGWGGILHCNKQPLGYIRKRGSQRLLCQQGLTIFVRQKYKMNALSPTFLTQSSRKLPDFLIIPSNVLLIRNKYLHLPQIELCKSAGSACLTPCPAAFVPSFPPRGIPKTLCLSTDITLNQYFRRNESSQSIR